MELKLLNKYTQQPMSKEGSHALVAIMMHSDATIEEIMKDPQLNSEFLFQVLTKRLDYFQVKVDGRVKLALLAVIGVSTPGDVALWVHTLYHLRKARGVDVYTASDLCEDFASGFPDQTSMKEAWDAQKNGGANLVDGPTVYEGLVL